MKKGKRLAALLLVVVFAMTTVLAGCGAKSTNDKVASTTASKAVSTASTTQAVTTPEATAAPEPAKDADPNSLPRNETLYFGGLQWGAVVGWNPLADTLNNSLALVQAAGGSRSLMFESLYMYNMLDNSMKPLLADGPYTWNAALTEITVKLKGAAKWSDGTPVTADDVAYTFEANKKIGNAQGTQFSPYIDSVTAVDSSTILIKAKLNAQGKAVNPLLVVTYLGQCYVIQKAWIQKVETRSNNDAATIIKDTGDDVVFSGPYSKYYTDAQKVVLIRNENYWGKDASMWGSLPVPKYICHTIYADNPATEVAFKAGEVDVSQLFIPNVQDLWLKDNLPISTYMDKAPYGICANMPTAFFNLSKPGLDNIAVRKAIAMAVDYDAINQSAMTGQSPSFKDVPRSVMNPTPAEQASYDHAAVTDLQWAGNDIEGANKLLDKAGIVDKNGDGIREYKGKPLKYNASCPKGWTDWMASMEIVAAAGKKIGIDITTNFPEAAAYLKIVTAKKQSDYDIFMMWTNSADPSEPWGRVRNLMDSAFNGIDNNYSGNYGHYSNKRIEELLNLIPSEADAAKLKAYYTECVKIYLSDIPSFSLMYRPNLFHAVNESVWTNYPDASDGKNIPPLVFTDGYSIAGLYQLKLVTK